MLHHKFEMHCPVAFKHEQVAVPMLGWHVDLVPWTLNPLVGCLESLDSQLYSKDLRILADIRRSIGNGSMGARRIPDGKL